MKLFSKIFLALNLFLFLFIIAAEAQTTAQRADCFAFETLPAAERRKAEALLLKALDGEALYTIVGGLKPMSSGFQSFRMMVELPRMEAAEAEKTIGELGAKKEEALTNQEKGRLSLAKRSIERRDTLKEIDETKRIFGKWRCGEELYADIHHYAQSYEGRRFYDAVVFSRPALAQMLAAKIDFFSRIGVTAESQPLETLYAVEYNQSSQRFAGYGYLFGYPDYAVRFFVEASDDEKFTGKFVERGFINLPTVSGDSRFVYAVPKNHAENEADKTLRAKADKIFNEYKRRRAEYIGEGKKGVAEMMRDWFCDANGRCAAGNARLN